MQFSTTYVATPASVGSISRSKIGFPCTVECEERCRWFLTQKDGKYFAVEAKQGGALGLDEYEWPLNSAGEAATCQDDISPDHIPIALYTLAKEKLLADAKKKTDAITIEWHRPSQAEAAAKRAFGENWSNQFEVYKAEGGFSVRRK